MKTECNQQSFAFHPLGKRDVVARFDGGTITSDAGGLLLREVERETGHPAADLPMFRRSPRSRADRAHGPGAGQPAACSPWRWATKTSTTTTNCGTIRCWPCWSASRIRSAQDRPLAPRSRQGLGRQEHAQPPGTDAGRRHADHRYKKIVAHQDVDRAVVPGRVLPHRHHRPPRQIVLDLDATDDPVHGHQLGRFFHGYYDHYCYLPLYIFCGEHLLCAKLRPADIDAASGTVQELDADRRADSPPLAARADHAARRQRFLPREHDGLVRAKPRRLRVRPGEERAAQGQIAPELHEAREYLQETGSRPRVSRLRLSDAQELESAAARGRQGRAIAGRSEPAVRRHVADRRKSTVRRCTKTSTAPAATWRIASRSSSWALFADRTSAETMRANQLRLWLSSVAYVLLSALRRRGLGGHGVGRRPVRHHSPEAVEDRRRCK